MHTVSFTFIISVAAKRRRGGLTMFKINNTPVVIERYPDETLRLNIEVATGEAAATEAGGGEGEITIEWLFEKDEEMVLFFIVKHLRENYKPKRLFLKMPYIPHARMDRVKGVQEVFTLKYFCEFINSLEFDKVIVRDAHSNVSLALLNNVVQESVAENITKLASSLLNKERDIVFYPDRKSVV